ncbi:polysaccharide deacetylase family protein [Uliginosibacterium sp. TH139]|uniref:polysaccharide deacetylase family protein n=1 Tax=Uliginosibacterium sp. TH139 TaxID=2067453 RepID=UPI001C1F6EFE|nr:polysaccharide deacetylase family protein [Uliginosibacterium sp. TH139]
MKFTQAPMPLPLRQHGRYDYSPITERPDFSWPGGKRLAVFLALNLEHYAFNEGIAEDLVPGIPAPDVLNNSWRDYGNRVGAWRLLDLFRELDLPVTLLINSALYDACPPLIAAFREAGAEVAAHGRTNSEHQAGFDEATERSLICDVRDSIAAHEGTPPAGWLSPWIAETAVTPDLLHEAGYQYLMDWCMDDQPVWLNTRGGRILSMPYPQEINDSAAIIGRQIGAEEFADMIVDQFDEMLLQSAEQPLVMSVALHSMIIGQPFRMRHLRRALAHIAAQRERCWLARAKDIASHFATQQGG